MDGRSAATIDGEEIETDVCVIGAGPAGLTLTNDLELLGIRTCTLDSGGLDVEPRIQDQSTGESDGYPICRLDQSRVRAFGGSLRHAKVANDGWAARPLDPIDFESLSEPDNIAWPFGADELKAHYSRAAATCGIRTQDEAITWWSEHASTQAGEVALAPLAPAVFQFTKRSFSDSWSILSTSTHVRLLLHTRVVDIDLDASGGRVARVVAVRGTRSLVTIRPRAVVLAAGGIENARLLLTANGRNGIGNEHDLVGRFFAERMTFHAGHLRLADQTSIDALALLHRPPGHAIGGGLRVDDETQRELGLRNCAFFLMPRPAAVTNVGIRSLSTLRKSLSRRPLIDGGGHHLLNSMSAAPHLADVALGRVIPRPQCLLLRAQGEPTPNRESRVSLASRRDDLGIPVARVTWRPNDGDFDSIKASAGLVDSSLRANGLGSVEWTAEMHGATLIEGNHHHLGTTRMHPDPRSGVVDPDCRVHSAENLFIAGSSVFPRYGASNPTLTIIALAHRLASHLSVHL